MNSAEESPTLKKDDVHIAVDDEQRAEQSPVPTLGATEADETPDSPPEKPVETVDDLAETLNEQRLAQDAELDYQRYGKCATGRWARFLRWSHRNFVSANLLTSTLVALMLATVVLVTLYAWLYIGSMWFVYQNVTNYPVLMVDSDTGFSSSVNASTRALLTGLLTNTNASNTTTLGSTITSSLLATGSPSATAVKWVTAAPMSRQDVVDQVLDGSYGVAYYIPSNLSDSFATFFDGSATPSPMSVEVIFQLPQGATAVQLASTIVARIQTTWSLEFATYLYAASQSSAAVSSRMNQLVLVQSVGLTRTSLNPIDHFGQQLATYMLPLVAWIGCIAIVMVLSRYFQANIPEIQKRIYALRMKHHAEKAAAADPSLDISAPGTVARLSRNSVFPPVQLLLSIFSLSALTCLLQALMLWLVPTVLPYSQSYVPVGQTFGFLWFLSLVYMCINYLLAMLIGINSFGVVSTLLLIIQIVTCGGIAPNELQNPFFRLGAALPMTYAVRQLRYNFFGAWPTYVAANYGILLGWGLGSLAVLCVVHYFRLQRFQSRFLSAALADATGASIIPARL